MADAPFAFFFRLVRTFSLPGMTIYSASKSLSRSTPILLFGRSFTWPSEASTSKSLPRYLLIVFAFDGDSTMTKALDKVLSLMQSLLRNYHKPKDIGQLVKMF